MATEESSRASASGGLRARQRLGKYRIERRIASGGFAHVYRAFDTLEGVPVAIKVPHQQGQGSELVDELTREVRLTTRLDHSGILKVKNATLEDGLLLLVYPLGVESLEERLRRRLARGTMLTYARQMLEAVAHAHGQRILHCDIKPDNFILFPGDRLRLTDFGIAKVAAKTRAMVGSGSGTVGYLAPEQALGKPSPRSDVFSLGLVLWRMLSGRLPEWPFRWPLAGLERIRAGWSPDVADFLRKALEVDESKRFADARAMLQAFERIASTALEPGRSRKGPGRRRSGDGGRSKKRGGERSSGPGWRELRERDFVKRFAGVLRLGGSCGSCGGPLAEAMQHCPWCGDRVEVWKGDTDFPVLCGYCGRGNKLDWTFCAWCWSPGIEPETSRQYPDRRYVARCTAPRCTRRDLMPFMRYCPWCHSKTERAWMLERGSGSCPGCRCGVAGEHWEWCAWCGRSLT